MKAPGQKNIYINILLILVVAFFMSSVQAAPPSSGHGESGHGKGKKHDTSTMMRHPHNAAVHFLNMTKRLNLSDKQVASLVALRNTYITDNAIAHEQLMATKMDIGRLLSADDIDLDAVNMKLMEVAPLELQVWQAFAKQLQEIKAILTSEQKKLLSR